MTENLPKKSFTRRLFSHTLNFGLGSVLPKVIGFILIPVYTIYLTPEDFGIVELATSFGAFLLVFMRLGIPGSVTRFYYDFEEKNKLRDYVTTIFWFLIGCSVVIGGLTYFLGYYYLEGLIPGLPFYPFAVIMILVAFFNSNTDLQRRLIQVREQSVYSAKLSTATALITILFSVIFVIGCDMGALGIVLALLITAIVFFVQGQFYLSDDLKGKIEPTYLKPSFMYAMGVLPSHLIGNFAPLLNKALLAGSISVSAVGILGIAIRFTNPLNIFIGAFQSAYLPIYFSYRKKNDPNDAKRLERANSNIWFVACLLFLGSIFFLPAIMRLLTPVEFHESTSLVSIIALGFLVRMYGNLFTIEIYYNKATYWIPFVTALAIGSNLFVVVFSVKYWGAFSVALGLTVGYFVSTVLYIFLAKRTTNVPKDNGFFNFTFIYCLLAFLMQIGFSRYIQIGQVLEILLYGLTLFLFLLLSHRYIKFDIKTLLKFNFK